MYDKISDTFIKYNCGQLQLIRTVVWLLFETLVGTLINKYG